VRASWTKRVTIDARGCDDGRHANATHECDGCAMNALYVPLVATAIAGAVRVPREPAPPSATAFYASTFARRPSAAELAAVGGALFADPSLSASGKLACATCHDPAYAHGPPPSITARPVAMGGPAGKTPGLRAVPSLRYLQQVPRFDEHYQDSDGDGTDQGPAGGLAWDGRAATAHDQARAPLFSPFEMANGSDAALVARVAASREAGLLRSTFGDDVFARDASAMKAIVWSLEVYQEGEGFAPYSSRYDRYLRGKAALTDAEQRGLRVFEDPAKGNCASCHPSRGRDGAAPLFTDYGFIALGVPRNPAIAANKDPAFFDLGLCGPLRTDYLGRADYCGRFRTPSLRNVATRRRFMHNGVFTSLADVVRFYATRDTAPARWYPHGVADDLPARYRGNLEQTPPFGRARGGRPALTDREIADVVAFLGTLTDAP
jgi:cytochrome c peroxidase